MCPGTVQYSREVKGTVSRAFPSVLFFNAAIECVTKLNTLKTKFNISFFLKHPQKIMSRFSCATLKCIFKIILGQNISLFSHRGLIPATVSLCHLFKTISTKRDHKQIYTQIYTFNLLYNIFLQCDKCRLCKLCDLFETQVGQFCT